MVPWSGAFAGFTLDAVVDAGGGGVIFRARDGAQEGVLKVFLPDGLGARPFRGGVFTWGFLGGSSGTPPTDLPFTCAELADLARDLARSPLPHVLAPIAAGAERGTPWHFSPWCALPTLRAVLEGEGAFDRDRVLRLAETLATAIDALHARGLEHGALDAAHVHVDPATGDAILADAVGGFVRARSAAMLLEWADRRMCEPPDPSLPIDAPRPPLLEGAPSPPPPPRLPSDAFSVPSPGADRADWAHLIAHAAIGARSAAWEDEGRKDVYFGRRLDLHIEAVVAACPTWLAGWVGDGLRGAHERRGASARLRELRYALG